MWYRTGTVAVTANSKTVTGTGTAWVQNARVGDGFQGPDGRLYEITNVASNGTLAIDPAYRGATASGQQYWIIPIPGYLKLLADRAAGLIDSVGLLPGEVAENERRIANAEQAMLTKTGNLAGIGNQVAARNNLGLGSAATRDVVSSNIDRSQGLLLSVGFRGLGDIGIQLNRTHDLAEVRQDFSRNGFYYWLNQLPAGAPIAYASMLSFSWSGHNGESHGGIILADRLFYQHRANAAGVLRTHEIYSQQNVTVDSNGFLKKASPIVQIFSKKIEKTDHKEIENIGFKRISTGVYELTNAPLLSRDGWYIETPKDRNNNIYFTVDYEENIEEKTLTIRTHEPDYRSGRATNGVPVDILDGRFISLRFSEDPSLYPAPDGLESKG